MRPVSPRFIACDRSLADGRIIVYGIPFEGQVNLPAGQTLPVAYDTGSDRCDLG